jgi:hypothetical protein
VTNSGCILLDGGTDDGERGKSFAQRNTARAKRKQNKKQLLAETIESSIKRSDDNNKLHARWIEDRHITCHNQPYLAHLIFIIKLMDSVSKSLD